MQPLVSVVIANYNYGRFLEDAIVSVITQGMGDQLELIICDGGSTDNSIAVIRKYAAGLPPNTLRSDWSAISQAQEARETEANNTAIISWWCSEKDQGQSDAFNKGFAHAKGAWGCWLNADDIMLPGALETVVDYIRKNPSAEWISGSCVFSDVDLRIWKCSRHHKIWMWMGKYLPAAPVNGPSSFFLIGNLKKMGGFDITAHYTMDIDLWRRFALNGIKLHQVNGYLWCFRCHEQSKTSNQMTTGVHDRESNEEADRINLRYGITRKMRKISDLMDRMLRLVTGAYFWSFIDTVRYSGKDARKIVR